MAGERSGQGLIDQRALCLDFGGYLRMIILNHRRDRQTDKQIPTDVNKPF